jgi:hypothetical protein
MFYDDTNGDAFEVPERAKGKAGDEVPDAPLQLRCGIVENGIVGGYRALLWTASPETLRRPFLGI